MADTFGSRIKNASRSQIADYATDSLKSSAPGAIANNTRKDILQPSIVLDNDFSIYDTDNEMFRLCDNVMSLNTGMMSSMIGRYGSIRGTPTHCQLKTKEGTIVGHITDNVFDLNHTLCLETVAGIDSSIIYCKQDRIMTATASTSDYVNGSPYVMSNTNAYKNGVEPSFSVKPVDWSVGFTCDNKYNIGSLYCADNSQYNVYYRHTCWIQTSSFLNCREPQNNMIKIDELWRHPQDISIVPDSSGRGEKCVVDALIKIGSTHSDFASSYYNRLIVENNNTDMDYNRITEYQTPLSHGGSDIFNDEMLSYAFGRLDLIPDSRHQIVGNKLHDCLGYNDPYNNNVSNCTCYTQEYMNGINGDKSSQLRTYYEPYSSVVDIKDNLTSNKDILNNNFSFDSIIHLDNLYEYCSYCNCMYFVGGRNSTLFGSTDSTPINVLSGTHTRKLVLSNYCNTCSVTDQELLDRLKSEGLLDNIYDSPNYEKTCLRVRPFVNTYSVYGKDIDRFYDPGINYVVKSSDGNNSEFNDIIRFPPSSDPDKLFKIHYADNYCRAYRFRSNYELNYTGLNYTGKNDIWVKDGFICRHKCNQMNGFKTRHSVQEPRDEEMITRPGLTGCEEKYAYISYYRAYDRHRVEKARKFLYCGMSIVNCENIEVGRTAVVPNFDYIYEFDNIGTGDNYTCCNIPMSNIFDTVKKINGIEMNDDNDVGLNSSINDFSRYISYIITIANYASGTSLKSNAIESVEIMNQVRDIAGDLTNLGVDNNVYERQNNVSILRNQNLRDSLDDGSTTRYVTHLEDFYSFTETAAKKYTAIEAKNNEMTKVTSAYNKSKEILEKCPDIIDDETLSKFISDYQTVFHSLDNGINDNTVDKLDDVLGGLESMEKEIAMGLLPYLMSEGTPVDDDTRQRYNSIALLDRLDILDSIMTSESVLKYGRLIETMNIPMILDLDKVADNNYALYLSLMDFFDVRGYESDKNKAFSESHYTKRFLERIGTTNTYYVRQDNFNQIPKRIRSILLFCLIININQNFDSKFCEQDIVIIAVIEVVLTVLACIYTGPAGCAGVELFFASLTILSTVSLAYMQYTGHGTRREKRFWKAVGIIGSIGSGYQALQGELAKEGTSASINYFEIGIYTLGSATTLASFISDDKAEEKHYENTKKIKAQDKKIKNLERSQAERDRMKSHFIYSESFNAAFDPFKYSRTFNDKAKSEDMYNTYDTMYGTDTELLIL